MDVVAHKWMCLKPPSSTLTIVITHFHSQKLVCIAWMTTIFHLIGKTQHQVMFQILVNTNLFTIEINIFKVLTIAITQMIKIQLPKTNLPYSNYNHLPFEKKKKNKAPNPFQFPINTNFCMFQTTISIFLTIIT
jgi:hypothetical protein